MTPRSWVLRKMARMNLRYLVEGCHHDRAEQLRFDAIVETTVAERGDDSRARLDGIQIAFWSIFGTGPNVTFSPGELLDAAIAMERRPRFTARQGSTSEATLNPGRDLNAANEGLGDQHRNRVACEYVEASLARDRIRAMLFGDGGCALTMIEHNCAKPSAAGATIEQLKSVTIVAMLGQSVLQRPLRLLPWPLSGLQDRTVRYTIYKAGPGSAIDSILPSELLHAHTFHRDHDFPHQRSLRVRRSPGRRDYG